MEKQKIIRRRNYLYEVLGTLIGLVLIGIWWAVLRSWRKAVMAGCASYLLLAWGLRLAFLKHHRKGMKLLRAKNYSDAASAFEKSYAFFERHPNIDKYRFVTTFSSSAIPYQQMALNNMAICYLQMGEAEKALDALQKIPAPHDDFPGVDSAIEEIQKHLEQSGSE